MAFFQSYPTHFFASSDSMEYRLFHHTLSITLISTSLNYSKIKRSGLGNQNDIKERYFDIEFVISSEIIPIFAAKKWFSKW